MYSYFTCYIIEIRKSLRKVVGIVIHYSFVLTSVALIIFSSNKDFQLYAINYVQRILYLCERNSKDAIPIKH